MRTGPSHTEIPGNTNDAIIGKINDGQHTLARELGKDDERTMDQRRADVLIELLLGTQQSSVTTHVYVTVRAETLLGLDNLPGDLRGYGPLPAERVRELAFDLTALWSGVLVDDGGYPKKLAEKRYRFSTRLAEFIRLRDRTCSHTACSQPAEKCDIDHLDEYPHGETSADNGDPKCHRHHQSKTSKQWTTTRGPNGEIIWTGPHGEHHIRHPEPLLPHIPEPPPKPPAPAPDDTPPHKPPLPEDPPF